MTDLFLIPVLIFGIIWLSAKSAGYSLLVWFESNVFIEYIKLLNIHKGIPYINKFVTNQLNGSPQTFIDYLTLTKPTSFFIKLITCPKCLAFWVSLIFVFVFSSILIVSATIYYKNFWILLSYLLSPLLVLATSQISLENFKQIK